MVILERLLYAAARPRKRQRDFGIHVSYITQLPKRSKVSLKEGHFGKREALQSLSIDNLRKLIIE
jgi:hypothetical protein